MPETPLTLYDPRNGDPAFQLAEVGPGGDFAWPPESNYFTVLWLRQGSGTFWADSGEYRFEPNSLLFFNPYQRFRLAPDGPPAGFCLRFHANFFCVETHHEEVGCNGVLFNDVYGEPLVRVSAEQEAEFLDLLGRMGREVRGSGLANSEVLVAYLKVFLVAATRLKLEQKRVEREAGPARLPAALEDLKQLVEKHYRTKHAPGAYAEMLHATPKALGRLVKRYLGKTLTELIRERLVQAAKWELLHTTKPVKQVARELGFADVFYFSRLFKKATGCSPAFFRDYETAVRGGRNLSMR